MKKQIILIHGGDTFDTYEEYLEFLNGFKIDSLDFMNGKSWKNSLQSELGDEYEVLLPRMPNSMNAKYLEWKIWFEKLLPFFNQEISLIGNSLGGIFLVKYLAENIIKNRIVSLHLVGCPYDAEGTEYTMGDFILGNDLSNVGKQVTNINFYQSKDDFVVPLLNLEKYQKILPNAKFTIFENRGHFNQPEFPELVEDIINIHR